jgi:hypothetical protein
VDLPVRGRVTVLREVQYFGPSQHFVYLCCIFPMIAWPRRFLNHGSLEERARLSAVGK